MENQQTLCSMDPADVLSLLDLEQPGLETVAEAAGEHDAFSALLQHYRARFPLGAPVACDADTIKTADNVCDHILQWGPYEAADYGPDPDWAWDPRGDIEWVAAVYRFYWAAPLAEAYAATRDETYAAAFVELASDWIRKHRLEDWERTHHIYTHWKGFAWLDIQTGIRATSICSAFTRLVHAKAFTPEFLRVLLASLYDHQVKTMRIPMGIVHNKAVFEQRGFVNVAYHFREFRESREWMSLAMVRVNETFLAQTTADGVQREWSFGYHLGVLRDAVEIRGRMEEMGVAVPAAFSERIRAMYDYIFWVATPDLGAPMFGDASRPFQASPERSTWPLYDVLCGATDLLGDPKHRARAVLDRSELPAKSSHAFPEAGMYVMRSDWGPEQIHLGLHCSPLGISGHDQPDNGTFELYAYGRWLMPDSGFYTYGHDPEGRRWHRMTRVHQTLTLDDRDTGIDGRHLLWDHQDDLTTVVVENQSYEHLVHRRTVWFVNRRFFVLLDEAIGDEAGVPALHVQFAPGEVSADPDERRLHTCFKDANVLVAAQDDADWDLCEEEGWFAWAYGHRVPRTAFRFEQQGPAPVAFLTVMVPYRGIEPPSVQARLTGGAVGDDRRECEVTVSGEIWRVGRDVGQGTSWAQG